MEAPGIEPGSRLSRFRGDLADPARIPLDSRFTGPNWFHHKPSFGTRSCNIYATWTVRRSWTRAWSPIARSTAKIQAALRTRCVLKRLASTPPGAWFLGGRHACCIAGELQVPRPPTGPPAACQSGGWVNPTSHRNPSKTQNTRRALAFVTLAQACIARTAVEFLCARDSVMAPPNTLNQNSSSGLWVVWINRRFIQAVGGKRDVELVHRRLVPSPAPSTGPCKDETSSTFRQQ